MMKIKLSYNSTYEFSTAHIYDAANPPLFFEALSRPSPEWARLVQQWRDDGADDPDIAEEIVGRVIMSVRQEGGARYPLKGRKGAASLRVAIEYSNPGSGGQFMCHLALGHYNYHFTRLADLLGNSETPSTQSADGESQTSLNGRTEEQPEEKPVKQ